MKASLGLALVGFLGGVAFVAGCSDADTPTEVDYDDVAQALGGVTATGDGGGEIGTMHDAAAIARGAPTAGIDLKASGEFSCSRFGMSYDYQVECSDASGELLDKCGSSANAAEMHVSWRGDLQTAVLRASVERNAELTITSIQSGTAAVTGTSELTLDARFDSLFRSASREYQLAYHAEYDDVKVQRSPARVVGGSVTYALSVERIATKRAQESSKNFEMDAELVFAADGSATLTLDGEFTYAIDPETGSVAKM